MTTKPRIPRNPEGTQIPIDQRDYQISFDPMAFDNFVRSQGIWVVHHKAVVDPRGMTSRGDNRDSIGIRPDGSDGFIYQPSGEMQVLFTVNSNQVRAQDLGEIAYSTAYMTMPRFYPGTKEQVLIYPWDKFYLKDMEIRVVNIQFLEAKREGVDRLQYPAVAVEYIVDANGVWYDQDKDFEITKDGDIKWLAQKRPGWNPDVGRGTVFSIRYRYIPYFVVTRVMHEIRVAQITDPKDWKRYLERMPYQVQVVRELVLRDQNSHPDDPVLPIRGQYVDHRANYGPVGLPSIDTAKTKP